MKIVSVSVAGKFDTTRASDGEHWENVRDVWVYWTWEDGGYSHQEMRLIPRGFRWDGASRPDWIGWLIPRGGVFLLASAVHDDAFKERFFLSDGTRISRKHADMLFLELMRYLAAERVTDGWKAHAQIVLAETMYRAVRLFGEPVWDNHDSEFRAT